MDEVSTQIKNLTSTQHFKLFKNIFRIHISSNSKLRSMLQCLKKSNTKKQHSTKKAHTNVCVCKLHFLKIVPCISKIFTQDIQKTPPKSDPHHPYFNHLVIHWYALLLIY